jgi:hypothetical protein
MRIAFAVSFIGNWCDGTFVPDTSDVSVAEAGEFDSAVLCEEDCLEADIAVGGAVLVQEGQRSQDLGDYAVCFGGGQGSRAGKEFVEVAASAKGQYQAEFAAFIVEEV